MNGKQRMELYYKKVLKIQYKIINNIYVWYFPDVSTITELEYKNGLQLIETHNIESHEILQFQYANDTDQYINELIQYLQSNQIIIQSIHVYYESDITLSVYTMTKLSKQKLHFLFEKYKCVKMINMS